MSKSTEEILEFLSQYERITLKPVDGHGGKGIVFVKKGDDQGRQIVEESTRAGRHWIIAQQYLTDAKIGDKRILLIDDQPIGAVLRVHEEGKELNNLDQGATAVPSELNDRDYEICEALASGLIEQGIFFSSLDVIGGMLIEVNPPYITGAPGLTICANTRPANASAFCCVMAPASVMGAMAPAKVNCTLHQLRILPLPPGHTHQMIFLPHSSPFHPSLSHIPILHTLSL